MKIDACEMWLEPHFKLHHVSEEEEKEKEVISVPAPSVIETESGDKTENTSALEETLDSATGDLHLEETLDSGTVKPYNVASVRVEKGCFWRPGEDGYVSDTVFNKVIFLLGEGEGDEKEKSMWQTILDQSVSESGTASEGLSINVSEYTAPFDAEEEKEADEKEREKEKAGELPEGLDTLLEAEGAPTFPEGADTLLDTDGLPSTKDSMALAIDESTQPLGDEEDETNKEDDKSARHGMFFEQEKEQLRSTFDPEDGNQDCVPDFEVSRLISYIYIID